MKINLTLALILSLGVLPASLLTATKVQADAMSDYLFAMASMVQQSHAHGQLKQSWISDPEFRVSPEQDARDLNTETYSFRFRPVSGSTRRARKGLFEAEGELARLDLENTFERQLRDRYIQVIELAEQEALYAISQQELQLAENEVDAEERLSGSQDYNIARLQRTLRAVELLRLDTRQRLIQVKGRRQRTNILNLQPHIDSRVPSYVNLSERLANPATVDRLLKRDELLGYKGSLDRRRAQAKLKEAQYQVAVEKSESGFGLQLLELSYENKGIDSYNLTFGFRIPSQRYTNQRRAQEHFAAQRAADITDQLAEQHERAAIQDIYLQLETFYAIRESARDLARGMSAKTPTSAILLTRHQLDLSKALVEKHSSALKSFVGVLAATGLITRAPLTNWLIES